MGTVDNTVNSVRMRPNKAGLTLARLGEDMKHPSRVWSDPVYENESLVRIKAEYLEYLRGRAQAASPGTVDKYAKSLKSFIRSLERSGEPLVLGSLTPWAANRWVTEQRKEGLKEEGIASRLSALKVFSKKYVCEHLELSNVDLLRKVPRITPPDKPIPALTEDEREAILESFTGGSMESTRNRALLATYMATGLRFREVIDLDLEKTDRVSGEITVKVKGGGQRVVRLSPRALKFLKEYLKVRPPKAESGKLWLTVEGTPLSYWGGQSVFRRLKAKTGLKKLHAHVLRHTFAQVALGKGAERAMVQDMMGHKSDAMSRRYASNVRAQTAARRMPEFSPV